MRAYLLAAAVTALLLTTSAAAHAAPPQRPPTGYSSLTQSQTTTHFIVHYTTTGTSAISASQAATLGAYAETAYQWIVTTWGYPPPLDDGDGRTDIYVLDVPGLGAGTAPDEAAPEHTTAFLVIGPSNLASGYPVAHEFFHAIQIGIYQHEQSWLDEATAEWAGQNVYAATGLVPGVNWFPSPSVSLDCTGSSCADGDVGGYRGSIFFEHLDQRFGPGLVHDAYDRAAVLGAGNRTQHSITALQDALAARGTTLSSAFTEYAYAAVSGGIERPGVRARRPAVAATVTTGGTGTFASSASLVADHLALVTVGFAGNTTAATHPPCDGEVLALDVTLPAGADSAPAIYHDGALTPLAVEGDHARGEITWGTCASTTAVLVLPNASLATNGAAFSVSATVRDAVASVPPDTKPMPTKVIVSTKTGRRGAITVRTNTAMPGRLKIKATSRRSGRTRTYATASKKVIAGGTTTVTLRPGRTALALLRKARRLKLTIAVTFTPATGDVKTVRLTRTIRYVR
ncbi:MAG: hypothetical protein V9E83_10595 [Baekduia sp.]